MLDGQPGTPGFKLLPILSIAAATGVADALVTPGELLDKLPSPPPQEAKVKTLKHATEDT
jgi:hypothetical protein